MGEEVEMKLCAACGLDKPVSDFSFHKGRYVSYCKPCVKAKNKAYNEANKERLAKSKKEYAEKNQEAVKAQRKQFREQNRERLRQTQSEYYKNNRDALVAQMKERRQENLKEFRERDRAYLDANREEVNARRRELYRRKREDRLANAGVDTTPPSADATLDRAARREYAREWMRSKMSTDPKFKLDARVSTAIYQTLISNGATKGGRGWEQLVGYTVADLMSHLEAQFDQTMSWDNYGTYWHIDHIRPKSSYQFSCPEDPQFLECWSLTNLRPLERVANMSKGAKILPVEQ